MLQNEPDPVFGQTKATGRFSKRGADDFVVSPRVRDGWKRTCKAADQDGERQGRALGAWNAYRPLDRQESASGLADAKDVSRATLTFLPPRTAPSRDRRPTADRDRKAL